MNEENHLIAKSSLNDNVITRDRSTLRHRRKKGFLAKAIGTGELSQNGGAEYWS